MAKDYVAVNISQDLGAELVDAIERLRVLKGDLEHIRDVSLHNIDGADYVDWETLAGLPTGDGVTVYNLLNTTVSQLAHADVETLIDRVGRQ